MVLPGIKKFEGLFNLGAKAREAPTMAQLSTKEEKYTSSQSRVKNRSAKRQRLHRWFSADSTSELVRTTNIILN